MSLQAIPVIRLWQLNERHYGALQGLNKAETARRLGEPLVSCWRRSYAVRPPEREVPALNIPTGLPLVYAISDDGKPQVQ